MPMPTYIYLYIYICMYTETICNVPIKVFFLSGDFDNEMPAVNFAMKKSGTKYEARIK